MIGLFLRLFTKECGFTEAHSWEIKKEDVWNRYAQCTFCGRKRVDKKGKQQ